LGDATAKLLIAKARRSTPVATTRRRAMFVGQDGVVRGLLFGSDHDAGSPKRNHALSMKRTENTA